MIILDTETTGLTKPSPVNIALQPHMTEIAILKVNKKGKVLDSYQALIKPPISIDDNISKITGIDDKLVKKSPKFFEIWEDIANFICGEKFICGHNIMFDISMLGFELQRIDKDYSFPWPMNRICTIESSMSIKNKRMTQTALYEYLTNKKCPKAHRAMNDVKINLEIYKGLRKNKLIKQKVK